MSPGSFSYCKDIWSSIRIFFVAWIALFMANSSLAQGLVVLKETANEKKRLARNLEKTSQDLELLLEDAGGQFVAKFAEDWAGGRNDILSKLAGASREIERLNQEAIRLANQLEREYNDTRVHIIERTIGSEVLVTVRGNTICQNGEEFPICQGRAKIDLENKLKEGTKQQLAARLEKLPGIGCTPSQLMSLMYVNQIKPGKQKLQDTRKGKVNYHGKGTFRGYIVASRRDRLLTFGECGDGDIEVGDKLPKILRVSAVYESQVAPNCRSIAETVATAQAEAKFLKTVKSSVCTASSSQHGPSGTILDSVYCTGAGILPPVDTHTDWLSPCKARVTVSIRTKKMLKK